MDYKLNNLNQITTKSDDGWKTWTDYSYDKRGNTTRKVYYKNKKALTAGAYDYDESNRMVKGTNDIGEQSIYHFNGLGILATNEWIIKKNAYGYHDVTEAALTTVTAQDGAESEIILDVQNNKKQVKSKKPAEEVAASPELNKTSHVIKDFVIDYNSDAEENLMEYERYDEGLTYRYVYGVDKLGVTAYTIANGSASVTTDAGEIPLYYHMDHMGSSEFLTSDVTQRVTSWTSYDEWGNITHNAVLKCGTRELDLVKTYTGHERDSVLGQYYAKARMYDTADKHGSSKGNKLGDKRFTAVDPVKGNVRNPQSLVQYTYVLNNPLMYVDPLGMVYHLTLMKNGGGQLYQTDILDKNIITSGEKRYIGVRNFSDIIAAANRKIPNVNFDVNLINHAVVSLDYTAVSGASNNITLNLNHVGYNTNVRGAYFRYEQCGYTYVDLMTMSAKMGMQAYIYSDAEYQAYKDSIYEFYTGLNEKGYMVASATQVALGNYSESDITMLGTIGQIGAGLLGADLPADLRDLVYDLQHWNELVKNNPGQIALDTVGVLPLIGVIKYGDEAALVIKKADGTIEKVIKNSDTLYASGIQALQKINIDSFTIKNKHLNTSGGGWDKFNVGTEAEAHAIVREVIAKNKIVSVTDNDGRIGTLGQKSFAIILDAERVIGSNGETKIRVAVDELGNVWTVFPIK